MSTSIKTPDENPSNVESILSDMNGLPGYTIEPPGSRIETLLIMMNGAFASSIVASIDENFVMSITLKNNKGETIGTTQTIDLPLESVIVDGSYDSTNKKLVFVLENGNTIDVPIGDLVSGLQEEITANNKLSADLVDDTSATNKFNAQADWNQTTDTASDYIKNKPTLGTAAALDVATSGNASTSQVVKGNDTRLTDARNAADVSSWAKAANKPSYNGSEIALTGYTEAQSKSSVAATDTTNAAIGKLEYRVETNENNISLLEKMNGSKNLSTWSGGTVSSAGTVGNFSISLPSAVYAVSFKTSATSGATQVTFKNDSTTISSVTVNNASGTITQIATLQSSANTISVYSNVAATISEFQVISKTVYDAGFTDYQPYAMSNVELTAKEQQNENNISIEEVTSDYTAATGYTINSLTKIYKQGKHIFGQLVVSIDSGTIPTSGTTIATTTYKPVRSFVSFCGCGTDEFNVKSIGFVTVSQFTGTITANDTVNTNAVINVQIDYVSQ